MLTLNIGSVHFKPVKYVITISHERSMTVNFIKYYVIILDKLLLFIPENVSIHLDYSHDVLKRVKM